MTPAKCAARMQGLNGVAKKVYECVPIAEAWTSVQVMGAMRNLTGSTPDAQIVSGCLTRLVDGGLIKRIARDQYQRVPVQQKPQPEEPKMAHARNGNPITLSSKLREATKMSELPVCVDPPNPIELLAELSRSAEAMAEGLMDLTARINEVAQLVGQERASSEKVRRLKALLDDL